MKKGGQNTDANSSVTATVDQKTIYTFWQKKKIECHWDILSKLVPKTFTKKLNLQ